MARPKGEAKRIACPVCEEKLLPDLGPNKIPFHIKKGTIKECPGSSRNI